MSAQFRLIPDPESGAVRSKIKVPPSQVVTSFSSKSELSLHLTGKADPVLTFVGYAGADMESEDIRVRVWPAEKAIAVAQKGGMPNSLATIGLLWLATQRDFLRKQWSNP